MFTVKLAVLLMIGTFYTLSTLATHSEQQQQQEVLVGPTSASADAAVVFVDTKKHDGPEMSNVTVIQLPPHGVTCECTRRRHAHEPRAKKTPLILALFVVGQNKGFLLSELQATLESARRCGEADQPCDCTHHLAIGGKKKYPKHFGNFEHFFPAPHGSFKEYPLISGDDAYCSGDPRKYRLIFDDYDYSYVGALYHKADEKLSCCYNEEIDGPVCSCGLKGGQCP